MNDPWGLVSCQNDGILERQKPMSFVLLVLFVIVFQGLVITSPAISDTIKLSWPVDCQLREYCHIQQYVDHDPTSGSRDYRCGSLSYDGHKGTDIRTATIAEMNHGVAVLAAHEGKVTGIRNGMPDVSIESPDKIDVSGRECGNGVVLSHSNGWETQYCHLKAGSVIVRPGEWVTQGQYLGDIGLSGFTTFPHLHFSVRRFGEVVDPFAPQYDGTCQITDQDTLWQDAIPYIPTGILASGFATKIPDFSEAKEGLPPVETLSEDAPAIVAWAMYFGARTGDTLSFFISGPGGFEFNYSHDVERTQAQAIHSAGKRKPPDSWVPGTYSARVSYYREGQEQWSSSYSVIVTPD
ncbi:M23 family metallopeptidase [uncultured Ruegeria sp.]|uniref:M23 family metallopeptidase n=1 Tax=uncultured Ruegeria sp. TaxID=259304 RepID=UPI002612AA49|nr:M23 family metallopeptidase [uncultured Ruegeria sp.]